MATLDEQIARLDDSAAIRILTTITDVQRRHAEFATEWNDELRAAVGEIVAAEDADVPPEVTDGQLARAALRAIAEDATLREPLTALVTSGPPQRLATPELVLSVGALLVALQMGWSWTSADGRKKFEKKSLTGKHFVDFAVQLFGWLKGGK